MKSRIKVLITGATGFVGRHLIHRLLPPGKTRYEIFGTCFPEHPRACPDLGTEKGIRDIFRLDLRSENSVAGAVKRIRPDWIIHLAAVSNVHCSWQMRTETMRTNLMGTFFLFEAARAYVPGARILFISSSDVYGILTPRKKAFREGERSGVVSPYAFTKVSGELLAEFYAQIEKQDVVIARPFPHTGPGQGPDFVCADWARQIALIEKKQKIKGRNSRSFPAQSSVIEVGNLTTQRDYSDVRDVVRAYELLLQKGKPKEVYNVCSGRAIPLKKILDTLLAFSVCQIRVRVDPSKLRKSDIPYLAGNNRKIRIETGWKPQIPIQQTLRDLLEYWRKKI